MADSIVTFTQNLSEVKISAGSPTTNIQVITTSVGSVVDMRYPGASRISQMTDVDITGIADGETLIYDLAANNWKPGMAVGGGGGDVDGGHASSTYGLDQIVDGGGA